MDNIQQTVPPSAEENKGTFWKLQGIFFQPKETFQAIDRKPDWLVVVLILVVLSVGFTILMDSKIGFDNVIRKQMEQSGQQITEEQMEQGVAIGSKFVWVIAVVGTPITLLLMSAVFLLAFYLTGADISFKKTFSVVCYSFFALTVISVIISATIIMLSNDPTELDVSNLVASNLGALVDRVQHPALFVLLSAFDIFSLYFLFLLALGMSVTSKKSFGTSAMMVFLVWALYVLVKVGWAAAFSPKPPAGA